MYLSNLSIFGFKTFAQKVDLKFSDGITVIVGPNGCGKTNIVDSLRWCIGEQKTSVLRSDKMENVIFNGSKERKPLNFSEVSLTIENTRNILPTDYSEVNITRRLYRSGDSEYLINKVPCRLKDITDLFMDTGMGSNAYSVIELKMVEQMLSDKTEDRRNLFEEAAGVTKYKIRRRQTFSKLQSTKLDITRLNDIISEIEKKVGSLKRQIQKANRYNKLSEQLKFEEIRLALYKFNQLNVSLDPISERLTSLSSEADDALGSIAKEESQLEEINVVLIKHEQDLKAHQNKMDLHGDSMKAVEQDIVVDRERDRNLQESIQRYAQEKIELENKKQDHTQRFSQLWSELQRMQQQQEEQRGRLDREMEVLKTTEQSFQSDKERYENLRNQRLHQIEITNTRKNALDLLKQNLTNREQKYTELEQEIEDLQRSISTVTTELEQRGGQHQELIAGIEGIRSELEQKKLAQKEAQEMLEVLRSRKLQLDSEIKSLTVEIGILERTLRTHEGFPESVRYLFEQKIENMAQTIADLIDIDEPYKKPLEVVLGDNYADILCISESSIARGLALLKESNKGKATFINPARLESIPDLKPEFNRDELRPQVIGFADEMIRTDYPGVVSLFLSDVIFVDTFERATALANSYPTLRFVTLEGELVWGNFLISGGKSVVSSSIIGQREKLEELKSELEQKQPQALNLQGEISGKDQEVTDLLSDIENLTNQLTEKQREHQMLEKAASERTYKIDHARELIQRHTASMDSMTAELADIRSKVQHLEPEVNELDAAMTALNHDLSVAQLELEQAEARHKAKAQEVQGLTNELLKMDSDINAIHNERNSIQEQLKEIEAAIEKRQREGEKAREEIERLKEQLAQHEEKLSNFAQIREGLEKTRDALEAQVSDIRQQIQAIETRLRKLRREKDEFINVKHGLEQEKQKVNFEIHNLMDRIRRDYDFDLRTKKFAHVQKSLFDAIRDLERAESGAVETIIEPEDEAVEGMSEERQTLSTAINKSMEEIFEDELSEHVQITDFDPEHSDRLVDDLRYKIKALGPVNLEAYAEHSEENERLELLTNQRQDLLDAEEQLLNTIDTINQTAKKQFLEVFAQIKEHFVHIFTRLFEGGEANLTIDEAEDPLEATIEILARPSGKKIQNISLLSGGEKTLTAIALLFAIYLVKPSPFCILDEVDAPLDDTNIDKFTNLLRQFSENTQFIVVTHNKRTIEAGQNIFGITMQEPGVSKVVSVRFSDKLKNGTDNIEELIRENEA